MNPLLLSKKIGVAQGSRTTRITVIALSLLAGASASHGQNLPVAGGSKDTSVAAPETRVPVTFTGGFETDPRDRGRPVVLVAGALGVPPEVFREAFRHVRPAPAGQGPLREQAQQNKAALMDALGKYGVTNDRLDAVSNRYRYVRSRGEHWPTSPAEAYAVVEKGVVTRFVVTRGGSGYSSPPNITVPGISGLATTVKLSFSKDFDKNGAISAISIAPDAGK